jgi:hypothetical protein
MPPERVEFGAVRSECGCATCVANCRFKPGFLIPSDLERLVPSGADPFAWARVHLRASVGTKVLQVLGPGLAAIRQIGTLVPAHAGPPIPAHGTMALHVEDFACHWLQDGRCLVHAAAPFGCAFFSCRDGESDHDELAKAGVAAVMEDAQEPGLYTRLWQDLWNDGLRAPPRELRQEAMDDMFQRLEPSRPELRPRRRY